MTGVQTCALPISSVSVTEVPCPGLADAVQHADGAGIDAAVAAAAARTPDDVSAVVLGCTHYELLAERIRTAVTEAAGRSSSLPPVALYGSAGAVAAHSLRRVGELPAPEAEPTGRLTVLLNGREAALPDEALDYPEGRLLASVIQVY